MSKIGRKPIDIRGVQVEIHGQQIKFKGPKSSDTYVLPNELQAHAQDNKLFITVHPKSERSRDLNRIWGLHRAILANKLKGAVNEFEKKLEINGLGFKVVAAGKKLTFSLGYSHKIEIEIPKEVSTEIDKTGQKLTLRSYDKELVGRICSEIKSKKLPEPYKGTGIKLASEIIMRKAGKTKATTAAS